MRRKSLPTVRGAVLLGLLAALVGPVSAGPTAVDVIGVRALAPGAIPADTGTSVDEMPPAMRKAFIVGIQEALAEHGYDPGPADGIVGSRTRAAVRRYQRDAGLPVHGAATKELLDHLNFATSKVYATADPARTGLVMKVQRELSELGYYYGTIDGVPGPETRGAVRQYQEDVGLPVTGDVSEGLLSELYGKAAPTADY